MNKINNLSPMRFDIEMFNLIKDMKVDRIKYGTDKRPESDRRLSKAIARMVRQDILLYNTLIKSPLENDRKYKRR